MSNYKLGNHVIKADLKFYGTLIGNIRSNNNKI